MYSMALCKLSLYYVYINVCVAIFNKNPLCVSLRMALNELRHI